MSESNKRSAVIYILMTLLLFQGLSGLLGGYMLVTDPTGASLGIPLEWLEGSPFGSYLVPGLILLIVLGIFPLAVLNGVRRSRGWSRYGVLAVGGGLVIWLIVEVAVIGYHAEPPFQAIYGAVGLALLALAFMPGVRSYFGPIEPEAMPLPSDSP